MKTTRFRRITTWCVPALAALFTVSWLVWMAGGALADEAEPPAPAQPPAASAGGGSVVTEGVELMQARETWELLGLSGKGVKVGVISNRPDTWQAAACLGDLPQSIELIHYYLDENRNIVMDSSVATATCPVEPFLPAWGSKTPSSLHCADPVSPYGCGDESTAMMEIIHDLAPEAELAVVTSSLNHGSVEMQPVMEYMAYEAFDGKGADIIVDDLAVGDCCRFWHDDFALWTARLADAGVILVTSIGNMGDTHYFSD